MNCFLEVKKIEVKFKKFSSRARVPMLVTAGSACFDVFSSRSVNLEPGVTRKIKTDFGLKFRKKYVAKHLPRSGLSLKPVFLMLIGKTVDFSKQTKNSR